MLLRDLLGACFICCFLLVAGNLAGDPGVGWHLKTGEWIARAGKLPQLDPFLYPTPEARWIHDQWLSDYLFWRLFELGGMALLQAALIGLAVYGFIGVVGGGAGSSRTPQLCVFLALAALAPLASLQWFVRPVVFSFVLFALTYRICRSWTETQRTSPREMAMLISIFLIWSNLHPGFPLGFVLIALAGASFLLQAHFELFARALAAGTLALGSTFITPYAASLHQSILSLLSNPFYMQLNSEWRPPDFSEPLFLPFLLVIVVFAASATRGRPPGSIYDRLLLILFGGLSLCERRVIPYFAIVSVLPLSAVLEDIVLRKLPSIGLQPRALTRLTVDPTRRFLPLTTLGWCLITAVVCFSDRRSGVFPPSPSVQMAESLAAEPPLTLFHSPDMGGLITWYHAKGPRPSLDDRNQLCSVADYERYFTGALARRGWRQALSEASLAVVSATDPLRFVISKAGFTKSLEFPPLQLWRKTDSFTVRLDPKN